MKTAKAYELDEEVYYQKLSIRERMIDALLEKFGTLYKASKAFGRVPGFLYNYGNLYRLNNIYKLCELANVNLEWILTGKNKGEFIPINITYQNIIKEYYQKRRKRETLSETQLIFKLKHGGIKNIGINTLLILEKQYKKSIYYLIQG